MDGQVLSTKVYGEGVDICMYGEGVGRIVCLR